MPFPGDRLSFDSRTALRLLTKNPGSLSFFGGESLNFPVFLDRSQGSSLAGSYAS